jgi:alpha-glucoside transport system substrate-binding protein
MAMTNRLVRRGVALTGALSLAVTLAACGDDGDDGGGDTTSPECAAYEQYEGEGDVSVFSPITDVEADRLQESWAEFEDCTGITITYEGTDQFEAQMRVRVPAGNAPDLALTPQPGLIADMVATGNAVPAPDSVQALAAEHWAPSWAEFTTVDGEYYGAPMGSNVKSFVWYSPAYFTENGFEVPTSWEELLALSDEIAATGIKPWCAGIGSDAATGWPATDWVEDMMLRLHGDDVYQQWIAHEIPFNDPRVAEAFDAVGQILKNPDYVNGGYGDVSSIATTSFEDGGLPITRGECAMHRQASFYAAQWGDATVAEDGDVFAFYFPQVDPAGSRPVLGAAEFVVAFDDRPEVQAVQTYLASPEWATARAALGGWASANAGVDLNTYEDPIQRLTAETLQDPEAVLSFDASDLMPAAVGQGAFWSEITEWITGQNTQETVDAIEAAWP